MAGRQAYIDSEPCSVGAPEVIELLERIGWEKGARIVRSLSSAESWTVIRANRLKAELEEALRRLHKYEPPESTPKPRSYRSEWE